MENNVQHTELAQTSPAAGDSGKTAYLLHLADNALILGQRNASWCGHGPVLEQDIAITNITLDLIGQARNLYQYAALLMGEEYTEDKLAYLRGEREFTNCLLVELPNGDWAQTITRQFLFSAYQFLLYTSLKNSKDPQVAAIAEKSLKEVSYHLRWSSEWVIRLGDGTNESHARMENALENLWMYTGELFEPAAFEMQALKNGTGADLAELKKYWEENLREVFAAATLSYPAKTYQQSGGKEGRHTEQLGFILAEMQYLQRAYPGSEW